MDCNATYTPSINSLSVLGGLISGFHMDPFMIASHLQVEVALVPKHSTVKMIAQGFLKLQKGGKYNHICVL